MTANEVIERIQADTLANNNLNWRQAREDIHTAAEQTLNTEERIKLLVMFKFVMDTVEEKAGFAPEDLALFRDTRAKDYRSLLLKETLIGHHFSADLGYAVTNREIEAGRLLPDDELRQVVLKGMEGPHMSVQELMEVERKRSGVEKALPPNSGWKRFFGG